MAKVSNLKITNQTKGRLPSLPFVQIKNAILGEEYEISIAIVSPAVSRKLNKTHRGKDYPTNILSFPLSKNSGEVILELNKIKKDAPDFDMNFADFTKFLFIHGCLHLKGMEHSSTMERQEKKFMKMFS